MSRLADEKDPEILRKAVTLLENHNRALTKEIGVLIRELQRVRAELAATKGEATGKQLQIEAIEQRLAKLTKMVFGQSSEKRTPEQGAASTSAEGDKPDDKPKEKKKHPGHGPTEQPKLPRIDVDHVLDEADKLCRVCGGCLVEMKGEYEEHDEVDVVPMRFVIKHHRRQKCRCSCGACVETALGPDKLVPGGRYSTNFTIDVVLAKYVDHLPLERQVRMMARNGLVVTSQTLWDQIERLTSVVESVRPRLHGYILSHPIVGADETTWELMGKKAGEGKSWYVWALRARAAVYYAIKDSRSAKAAAPLLSTFAGTLMCDGYAAYASLSLTYPRVTLAHCWAHVRREFIDIERSFPQASREVVALIRELYALEKDCPKGPAGDDARREIRNEKSRDVIERIVAWFWRTLPTCLPESGLRKAIGYMVHMWPGLVLFLDDPRIPLDNNGTEQSMRGPVVGRKNHYGSRSLRGTEVAATLYSLVETAKLNELDPRLYLQVAVRAGLRDERVPLPHEVKAKIEDGSLDPKDYEDPADGIVMAALAAARAGPAPPEEDDGSGSASVPGG